MAKKGNKAKKNAVAANSAVLATNRKARHDVKILDTYEAGMVLVGTEIKAMREGKISLVDAFATLTKMKFGCVTCTSRNTPWGIGRTTHRSVPASCCCTGERSTS